MRYFSSLSAHLSKEGGQRLALAFLACAFLMACQSAGELKPQSLKAANKTADFFIIDDEALCEEGRGDAVCWPDSHYEAIALYNHALGCEPGLRGDVHFYLDESSPIGLKGQDEEKGDTPLGAPENGPPLAKRSERKGDEGLLYLTTVKPGKKKILRIPRGDNLIVSRVEPHGKRELFPLFVDGAGPLSLHSGCEAFPPQRVDLAPLLIVGPEAACPPVEVLAAGLREELDSETSWTLLLPFGKYRIFLGGEKKEIELRKEGMKLKVPSCQKQPEKKEEVAVK